MNFLKSFFFLLTIFTVDLSYSQDISSLSGQVVILQDNIAQKSFVKDWKKEKKKFEKECKNASSEKQLIILMNKLVSTYNSSTSSTLFKIPDLRFDAFCNALLNMVDQLPIESLSFTPEELIVWKNNLIELMNIEKARVAKIEEQIELERNKKRIILSDSIVVLFEKHYQLVFDQANKGSFSSLIRADERVKYEVNLNFGSSASCFVVVDQDDVYQFKLLYNTSKDKELAKLIEKGLFNVINGNLTNGFKESKMFDGSFVSSFLKIFDFQGQKFADTAKHPRIELGVRNDTFEVYFSVIEPLFKR
ncbi:MAG: hypothetical protein P8M12_08460 [Flavobacteriales bacterium]|nr:hypothetical protein [Flavobacteriales bacterium]